MATTQEPLMSSQAVARYLDVPIQTLYAWATNGTGPPSFVVGRHRRYRREDVDAWLEGRARAEPAAA